VNRRRFMRGFGALGLLPIVATTAIVVMGKRQELVPAETLTIENSHIRWPKGKNMLAIKFPKGTKHVTITGCYVTPA